ncbi:ABC transporter substrate-binding protein [Azonexus hydrophilus]|uniref:ABC transporter substrate-binding protein n=1 Tax=Azonexus hydrophilus TaxID=418702 RepID=UPI0003F5CA49|nr:extracellular solute-binding protein [Azonexus hydrophilus]
MNKRRAFLKSGLALTVAAISGKPAWSAPQTVNVVTGYPDEFVSRVEAAFEKAHPEYRLRVIWRMPADAAPYLRQPGHGGADVYWSASPRTFARLASEGIWRKLPADRRHLPPHIGKVALGDTAGYYTATEVAGFGFAVSPDALAKRGIAPPRDWPDLADPRLAGLIALPVPARVGFAPPLIDIVLQGWGWDAGWALWSEITANAVLIDRGSTFVTDEIVAGRSTVGVSIDFFVNAAIANGAKLDFIYPAHTGLNPAHIAVTRDSTNPDGAAAFVNFILSPAGQRLLAHPDIRRLPVRPDVYAELPATYYNPFAAAAAGGLQFDSDAARPRLATLAAAFQQMLIEPHAELGELWRRLRRAEAAGKATTPIRALLCRPPLSEAEANTAELQRQIGLRIEGGPEAAPSATEIVWQKQCTKNRRHARQALEAIKA